MSELVNQTMLGLNTGPDRIRENLQRMVELIKDLNTKLNEYYNDLKIHYKNYLELLKSTTNNATTTNSENVNENTKMPGYPFKEVDSMYHRLTKILYKISQYVAEDHVDIIAVANAIITIHEKQAVLKSDIDINVKLADSLDKFRMITQLKSKYEKAILNYNKLVATFNEYVMKLNAMKRYLDQGIIIYSSSTSGKKYSLSMNQLISWFKDLADENGVSLLRGEVISHMTRNYLADLQTLTEKPPITPISLMDPFQISRPKTPGNPSTNLGANIPSFATPSQSWPFEVPVVSNPPGFVKQEPEVKYEEEEEREDETEME